MGSQAFPALTMANPAELILHICSRQAWENAFAAGAYRADSLAAEGFIHCSRPDQALRVANFLFQGLQDLVILWIQPALLVAPLRWEPPFPPGPADTELFPHIYGEINLGAIVAVCPFAPEEDGLFHQLPEP